MKEVETILEALRTEGSVLAGNGAAFATERVARAVKDLETALADHLTWITEADALKRGAAKTWLQRHYDGWERQGYARRNPRNLRERQYRSVVIPTTPDQASVRERAKRAAQAAVRSAQEGKRA